MRIPGETTLLELLQPILQSFEDPRVTEVVIQEVGWIGVERAGKWEWLEVPEFDFLTLDAIGILAGSRLSKNFDPAHPVCLTTLPGGQRATFIRPPVTEPGIISITIRNPSQQERSIWDADFATLMQRAENVRAGRRAVDEELLDLYQRKDWPAFFSLCVRQGKTMASIGKTGSGKTTFLNRLMSEIPVYERVVTIEDTREFKRLKNRNQVNLVYGSTGVTAEMLAEAANRMRPDRTAIQELRGAEAFACLKILASGGSGCLTTWHADDQDIWGPLVLMVKQHPAGRDIPDDKIKNLFRSMFDVVAYCKRDNNDNFSVPSVWFRAAEEEESR